MKIESSQERTKLKKYRKIELLGSVLLIILILLGFYKADDFPILYPVVFLIAAVTNVVGGMHILAQIDRRKRSVKKAMFCFAAAFGLFLLGIAGCISMF